MFVDEEYYINLYVGVKFGRDPHVRYFGGEMLRIKREINLYVGHEINTIIFTADDLLLTATFAEGYGDGNQGGKGSEGVKGLNREGVEIVSNKGDTSIEGSGDSSQCGEVEVDKGGEGVKGLNGKGVEVASSKGGEVAGGLNSGVEEADEEGLKMKVIAEVPEEVEGEGLNDRVARKEEANEAGYFDSDDLGSILGSDDDNNNDAYRKSNLGMEYGFKYTIINNQQKVRNAMSLSVEHVLPPVEKIMPGRPKKKRRKALGLA
ncbi:hypothetical protein J1N35_018597 [Gossypium stocksii]|uniref:Uncharacterized protein n=1 Tax=Gossypium stocksii TaxID=47602 RepID=A0A9D3VRA0_9ROSI|nr:hypothetical protein J1N35_018597 [Gossypium stocksii]